MMTLDPNDSFFQEDSHSRDDDLKNAKDNHLYKETMALVKRKMCTAHDLLEQFNHKVKEFNDLNLELHESKLDKEKLFNKYNSTSERLTRLELSNRDYEKSCNDYKNTADKQKLELDEKKKHIEQLEFKIKEMEKDNSRLKDDIKKIQQENKISKSIAKKGKSQASQTNCLQQQDVSVNTDFKNTSPKKPQVRDKNMMTDQVTNTGKEPFPFFCSKCKNQLDFPPVRQILKIMSSPPPPSLSNQFSPPYSPPGSIPSNSNQSIASNLLNQDFHENLGSSSFDRRPIEACGNKESEESNRPSFMLLDKLTRKINNLERLVKKKKQKQKGDRCCHQTCSSSKNIKFVVQLPNEEKYFEYAKQHSRKKIHSKRLNKKQIKLKNRARLKARKWHVENDIETQSIESSVQHGSDQLEQSDQKYENHICINETDLFECPAIIVSNLTSNDQQISPKESLSTLDTNTNNTIVNLTGKDLVFDNENENEHDVQSNVSSPVLAHTSYYVNVKEAEQSMDCHSDQVFQTTDNECNLGLNALKQVNDDEAVDLNSRSLNDIVLTTKESDMNNITNDEYMDAACKSIEASETNVQATTLKVSSKLESQENIKETESIRLDIRRSSISSTASADSKNVLLKSKLVKPAKKAKSTKDLPQASKVSSKPECQENIKEVESTLRDIRRSSISSTASSENEQLSSTPVCVSTVEDSRLDIIKPDKSEQASFREIESSKKTNVLKRTRENKLPSFPHSSAIEKIQVSSPPRSRRTSTKSPVDMQLNLDDKICASMEENEQSSDGSLNVRCSVATDNKPGESSNIIESDDSSEENLENSNKDDRRKKLIAKRKKLISKIRNLRKTSKNPITCNILAEKASELRDEITPTCIPTKRQRVAHIPKDTNQNNQFASAKDLSHVLQNTSEIQRADNKNVLSKSKLVKRAKKAKSTKDLPQKTKKLKLMENVESEENDEKQSTISDVAAELEPILSGTESLERLATVVEDPKIETRILEDNNQDAKEEKTDMMDEHSKWDLLAPQALIKRIESTENGSRPHTNKAPSNIDENARNDDKFLDDDEKINEDQEQIPTRKLRFRKELVERPARRSSSRLKETSPSVTKSDTDVFSSTSSDCKKSRNKKKSKANKLQFIPKFDSNNSSLDDTVILSHLNDFLLQAGQENKKANYGHLRNNEKAIREQLSLLMESEPLATDVLSQVSNNLLSMTQLNVVALVLVEYAASEYLDDTKCDTMYTPPAPPMTKCEQKLVTLIMSIKERQPKFVDAVEKGLQYKLFRLGKPQEVHIVERLFRILVVLNKIKKDREQVRMLFCDALYCFNTRAMNIIYITLSCWSEVFPKHGPNNDILIKTIVYIIMSSNVNRPFSKLMPLKRLLTDYYGYPNSGFRIETFKEELMNNLKDNVPGVNTAILLLCKSKGAEWTLENVIKSLKDMIVKQAHPSMYDALTLLGNLLRPFSSDNLKNSLEEITDQLCDVLSGNTGLHDLEEGIVSCLLSIGSKFAFKRDKIAWHVLKWHSKHDLRPTTKEKFDSFLKTHTAGWWRKFIRQNFPAAD